VGNRCLTILHTHLGVGNPCLTIVYTHWGWVTHV